MGVMFGENSPEKSLRVKCLEYMFVGRNDPCEMFRGLLGKEDFGGSFTGGMFREHVRRESRVSIRIPKQHNLQISTCSVMIWQTERQTHTDTEIDSF